ncbi:hypothetical protein FQR65_LT08868 [Abscondita terminalis]|nr:hypothetical protein FQR65_LT08868 [Abscondita terminalis]
MFGFAPFAIKKSTFEKCWWNVFYSSIVAVFLNASSLYYLLTFVNDDSNLVDRFIEYLDYYSGQVVLMCGNLCCCISINQILDIFKTLHKFDKHIERMFKINLKNEYKKVRNYTTFGTVAVLVLAISVCILSGLSTEASRNVSLSKITCLIVPPFVNTLISSQICAICFNLKIRFSWLNNKIETTFMTHHIIPSVGKNLSIYRLIQLRRAHLKLCLITKKVNKAFALQFSAVITYHYASMVTLIIYVGRHTVLDDELIVKYVVFVFIQLCSSVGQFVFLVFICSSTSDQAAKTGSIIHMILYTKKRQLNSRINLEVGISSIAKNYITDLQIFFFSLQLLHQPVEFSACRCIVINETLLFTIAGVITKFLIIIVQFDVAFYSQ